MKIDKHSPEKMNFGDDLNNWLWPKLIPECLSEEDGIHFLGIGTLLKARRFETKLALTPRIVIFSSGSWGVDLPVLDSRCRVYGVRGPRTARGLGLSPDKVIGDGAYLLKNLPEGHIEELGTDVGFVPHHGSERYVDWQSVCDAAGLRFISPRQSVESFLDSISHCKAVITEAMHGAITSDLLRIPWVAVRFAPNFADEKWFDWAESMSINLKIQPLPMVYQQTPPVWKSMENRGKRGLNKIGIGPEKWARLPYALRASPSKQRDHLIESLKSLVEHRDEQLSSDTALAQTVERLNSALEKLREDYREKRF
ncbi:polysaccharide pyruvyl transferase family protein [Marinobacter sp. TBZ242]|uniref:Polysaccharide pyruvyl transferase family protein n=1 Tax=Marinobacter azerbaijanicus TaxID=3050455 RepID=A0ABT7II37_9GAMM|nr:polysaccharide pyruvyl transferase family protein [Marinobacter sp. TBZ242]MDL0433333.1 polysaccharide pyruvyl transferase family protein [Marinobacter sp. TBZ242]